MLTGAEQDISLLATYATNEQDRQSLSQLLSQVTSGQSARRFREHLQVKWTDQRHGSQYLVAGSEKGKVCG